MLASSSESQQSAKVTDKTDVTECLEGYWYVKVTTPGQTVK